MEAGWASVSLWEVVSECLCITFFVYFFISPFFMEGE